VNIIEQLLAQVPVVTGFVRLSVVDAATGQVLGSRSAAEVDPQPGDVRPADQAIDRIDDRTADDDRANLAACATEVLQTLATMVAADALEEELEDVMVTLSGHHHLIRLLPGVAGADLFLLLSLDRSRANLALARHQLLGFEARVVA
jgi:hypothetical protein